MLNAYIRTPSERLLVIKFSSSITDFLKIPSLFSYDVSANGELLVYSSNETGNVHLHLMHVKTGSKPKQLTNGQDPVFRGLISPRGDRLIARAGSECDADPGYYEKLVAKDPSRLSER